jgi:hypothetical protein
MVCGFGAAAAGGEQRERCREQRRCSGGRRSKALQPHGRTIGAEVERVDASFGSIEWARHAARLAVVSRLRARRRQPARREGGQLEHGPAPDPETRGEQE